MLLAQKGSFIEGYVRDQKTGKPLQDVNVYISSSTIGTSTNKQGYFKLEHISPGIYQVVFTSLGYVAASKRIILGDNDFSNITIGLKPQVYSLAEVKVKGKIPKVWRRRLSEFIVEFLGNSSFADQCKIINPEVLDFSIDHRTGQLMAKTDSTLVIENDALGYKLYVHLDFFGWSGNTGSFKIHPFFKVMKPVSTAQMDKWKSNREEAYEYSFRHFIYALSNQTARQEGYQFKWGINKLDDEDNMYQLGKRKIYENIKLTGFHIFSSMFVYYEGTKSEIVKTNKNYFFVDPNGNLLNPLAVSFSGSWGNQRVASMLPFNYHPAN